MDFSYGAILWSTLGSHFEKGNYCILIFRNWSIGVVPMGLWPYKGIYYILGYIHRRINFALWGYKYQHLIYPVDKSQAKGPCYRAHQAVSKAMS